MSTYGVIDLGSNSIRLVVFELRSNWDGSRPVTGKNFKDVFSSKVMAGLASYVEHGEFTKAGICKAISVLKGLLKSARIFGCKQVDIFATAVLRNCANSATALAVIESSVGAKINLLSAKDEAHLSFIGATCDKSADNGVMVDLGGGSVELVRVEDGIDHDDVSIPQGSLSSYKDFVEFIIPQAQEADAIRASFNEKAAQVAGLERYRAERLYGVGGSARATAKLLAAALNLQTRPKLLTTEDLDFLVELLIKDPARFSHLAARAVPERIHTVGPGCIILNQLAHELGGRSLEICKRGVREGYLIERMLAKGEENQR